MRFSIVALPLVLLLTAQDTTTVQDPLAASDAQIYQAVLDRTVRPYIVNFSNRMDAQPPYSLLVVDETMALCAGPRPAASRPCLDWLQLPGLSTAILERNRVTAAFPRAVGPDVVLIPHDGIPDAVKAWKDSTYGYLSFSRPGYPSDGHAIVWVYYDCGRCGRGWLFLLHQESDQWRVDEARVLVVS